MTCIKNPELFLRVVDCTIIQKFYELFPLNVQMLNVDSTYFSYMHVVSLIC